MFVPVACLKCGKPFQVPDAAAGTTVDCPWCKSPTPALPVAGLSQTPPADARGSSTPAPVPREIPPADAGGSPTPAGGPTEAIPTAPVVAAPAAAKPRSRFPFKTAIIVLILSAVAFLVAAGIRGYRTGQVPFYAWREFTPPDGSFRVALPGEPAGPETTEPIADFTMTRPGERYVARSWYAGVTASVGWVGIDPARVKDLRLEDLAGGEADRRKQELGATAWGSGLGNRGNRDGMEYTYETPNGRVIDRMILVRDGPNPRLYVLSYSAPGLRGPDHPNVIRFFDSFKVEK
jgi:hypothetical protein